MNLEYTGTSSCGCQTSGGCGCSGGAEGLPLEDFWAGARRSISPMSDEVGEDAPEVWRTWAKERSSSSARVSAVPGTSHQAESEADHQNEWIDQDKGWWNASTGDEAGTDLYYSCSTPLCDPSGISEYFKWGDSDCHDCSTYEEIIYLAWCVLVENLDLVRDALYSVLDWSDDRVLNVLDWISGDGWFLGLGQIKIYCTENLGGTASQKGYSQVHLSTSYLNRVKEVFDAAKEYCHTEKFKGQMCAVCDLACTILHEITHASLIAWIDTDYDPDEGDDGTRTKSYEIENYFRYVVMKRYCVLGWGACDYGFDDNVGVHYGNYEALMTEPWNQKSYVLGLQSDISQEFIRICESSGVVEEDETDDVIPPENKAYEEDIRRE